ncbi:DUF6886 family protein [Paenibacillus sp. FSL W8-0187]|uniref:DUF6886 family protein n=1 Tax=Paenibacillus sp. FSL W8-0187 TaxID=2921710 RepID=UPI0030D6DCE7
MLYHFSEDPNIDIFVPRENQNRKDFPAVVWAIDKEHEFTYYFPRNCPRYRTFGPSVRRCDF